VHFAKWNQGVGYHRSGLKSRRLWLCKRISRERMMRDAKPTQISWRDQRNANGSLSAGIFKIIALIQSQQILIIKNFYWTPHPCLQKFRSLQNIFFVRIYSKTELIAFPKPKPAEEPGTLQLGARSLVKITRRNTNRKNTTRCRKIIHRHFIGHLLTPLRNARSSFVSLIQVLTAKNYLLEIDKQGKNKPGYRTAPQVHTSW